MDLFPITPAPAKTIWILFAICTVIAIIAGALAYTAWSSRNVVVALDAEGIRIKGDFWGRTVPYASVDPAGARVIGFSTSPELATRRRTFGTALPGYASGWFRLQNGEKALAYLTRRNGIAYVPTRAGYSLLLSVDEPHRFLERLATRAGQG